MKRIVALAAAGFVAACSRSPVGDYNDARRTYKASLDTYKACVQAKGAAACQNEKAVMDADLAAYNSMSRAVNRGVIVDASQ